MPDRRVRRRQHSGAIDQGLMAPRLDELGRVTGSTIRVVKLQHDPRWGKTRDRAAKCRTLLAGELGLVMPKNFQLANAADFAADLPTPYVRSVEQLSFLQQKRCEVKRYPSTVAPRALEAATTLEQVLSAVMDELYPWAATCDVVQNDALCFVVTQPDFTFWEQAPSYRDDQGAVKPRYERDARGRTRRDAGKGYRASGRESVKAYDEELKDWYANHIPLRMRAFAPQQVTPIFGSGDRLDAVVVSSTYLRTSEITQKFLWGEGGHLSPTGNAESALGGSLAHASAPFGEVELLEYFGLDERGKPYVAYCVDGAETFYRDTGEPAVIDLSPYTDRLPVAVAWGQSWPGVPDLDQRGLPFMWPFYQSARQANAVATGVAVASWWVGFPTYTTTPDPKLPGVVWQPGDSPTSVDIEPLKIIETPGPLTRVSGGEVSPDVWKFLAFLLGENEKNMPDDGDPKGSGFSQTVAAAYAEKAQHQILEGVRSLYEQTASFALEQLSKVGAERRPVCVYYAGPVVSPADDERTTSSRVLLELDPDLAGDQWKVAAVLPKAMSLAERQQSAELVERRLKTRRKHFEDDGDPAPERTAAEIEAEDIVTGPIGQTTRLALVSRILGDSQMAEQVRLMAEGKISPVGKLPYAVAEGFGDIMARSMLAQGGAGMGQQPLQPGVAPGGVPPRGQMTGLGGPSTAQASLAGAVGGAMQAGPINRAEQAGVSVPSGIGG